MENRREIEIEGEERKGKGIEELVPERDEHILEKGMEDMRLGVIVDVDEGDEEGDEVRSGSCSEEKLRFSTISAYDQYSHFGVHETDLMLSIEAPLFESGDRANFDCVCVLDKSGSMDRGKMDLLKQTVRSFIDEFSENDRLSIVTYSDTVSTVLPLDKMTDRGKKRAKTIVDSIHADGCTNLVGGLLEGINVLNSSPLEQRNSVSSVLLLTDGLANVGDTDPLRICHRMKKVAQSPIYTFGFGSDHSVRLMKAIAEKGSGMYYFIEGTSSISPAFASCLGGIMSVVAQNISIVFEAVGGVEIIEVMSKFNTTELTPKMRYKLDIRDIQSEEKRDILLRVKLPSLDEPSNLISVMTATITYENTVKSVNEKVYLAFQVRRPKDALTQTKNEKVDIQQNRILVTKALEKAGALAVDGKLPEARDELDKAISVISESLSANDNLCKQLIVDLKDTKSSLASSHGYQTRGQYVMDAYTCSHTYQRATTTTSVGDDDFAGFSYVTSSRVKTSKSMTGKK